jgi:hypothetical protein
LSKAFHYCFNAEVKGGDIKDYNTFMALCRGFYKGCMMGEWACTEACLRMTFFDKVLWDAEKRRTVELFESCGPHIVIRKQYEDVVSAQREKKLEFEYTQTLQPTLSTLSSVWNMANMLLLRYPLSVEILRMPKGSSNVAGRTRDWFTQCSKHRVFMTTSSQWKSFLPPGVSPGGHGGSHGYLGDDFIDAILRGRKPRVDVIDALNMTVPGYYAHLSSMKNGETKKIPQYSP